MTQNVCSAAPRQAGEKTLFQYGAIDHLVIASWGDDIAVLRAQAPAAPVLALTNSAAYQCRRYGIRCIAASDLFDENEWRQMAAANSELLYGMFRSVDGMLNEFGIDPDFRIGDYRLFGGRMIDRVLLRIATLGAALGSLRPREISFCSSAHAVWNARLDPVGSLTARLLPGISDQLGIACREVPAVTESVPNGAAGLATETTLGRFVRRVQDAGGLALDFLCGSMPTGGRGRTAILAPSISTLYAFGLSGCRVIRNDAIVCGHEDEIRAKPWQKLFDAFLRNIWSPEPWRWRSVDYSVTVEHGLRVFFTHYAPEYEALQRVAKQRLAELQRPFILSHSVVAPEQIAINAAARSLGAPRFTLQHGGFNAYLRLPVLWDTELRPADYSLCWGEGSVAAIGRDFEQGEGDRRRAQAIAVCSHELFEIYSKRDAVAPRLGRPAVLYAVYGLLFEARYASPHLVPDHLMATLQLETIEHLANCAVDSTVRLYPNAVHPGFDKEFISDFIADCGLKVAIDHSQTFVHSAMMADVIVIDFPSTVLLQALATTASVAVLIDEDFYRLHPETERLLAKRAHIAFRRSDFAIAIDAAITEARCGPRTLDDGFLKKFGLGEHPEKYSVPRTVFQILAARSGG